MTKHVPPPPVGSTTPWARGTHRPIETMVASYTLFVALKVAALAPLGALHDTTLLRLPGAAVAAYISFLGLGGVLVLAGLLVRRKDLRREINVQQAGWYLLGIGWLAYAICADILLSRILLESDLGYALACGAAWKIYALGRKERRLGNAQEVADTGELPLVIDEEDATL